MKSFFFLPFDCVCTGFYLYIVMIYCKLEKAIISHAPNSSSSSPSVQGYLRASPLRNSKIAFPRNRLPL